MREILFRGKSPLENKWIEGLPVQVRKDYSIIRKTGKDGKGFYDYIVNPRTVSQFTGLTDKNGKKIFFNDIVETKYGRLCKVVSFISSCYCGVDLSPLETMHKPPTEHDIYDSNNLAVIGNIHDNPELLGVTK